MPHEKMPEGGIACLFTDMQDSTKLSAGLPPLEWQRVAAEHDRRVVACIERCGGTPERSEGDSFFARFPNSRDALLCAIAIQKAFPIEGN
jgi:class 3 adenylate cyclase